jgi:hypothetical protein
MFWQHPGSLLESDCLGKTRSNSKKLLIPLTTLRVGREVELSDFLN